MASTSIRHEPGQASATPYAMLAASAPPGSRAETASTGEYVCEVTPCRLPIDSSPAGSGTRNSPNSRAQ